MTTEIYIELLDEGTPTWRPTQGVDMGNGVFLVLPTNDYDPDDETWAFLPGSQVFCEKKKFNRAGEVVVATRLADKL